MDVSQHTASDPRQTHGKPTANSAPIGTFSPRRLRGRSCSRRPRHIQADLVRDALPFGAFRSAPARENHASTSQSARTSRTNPASDPQRSNNRLGFARDDVAPETSEAAPARDVLAFRSFRSRSRSRPLRSRSLRGCPRSKDPCSDEPKNADVSSEACVRAPTQHGRPLANSAPLGTSAPDASEAPPARDVFAFEASEADLVRDPFAPGASQSAPAREICALTGHRRRMSRAKLVSYPQHTTADPWQLSPPRFSRALQFETPSHLKPPRPISFETSSSQKRPRPHPLEASSPLETQRPISFESSSRHETCGARSRNSFSERPQSADVSNGNHGKLPATHGKSTANHGKLAP